ncbi:hypothetical protein LTR49_027167 [Elasticomyces elasticus]|nr:hypothetical protein LTR49_027167 [Elasticomyces elasticus]
MLDEINSRALNNPECRQDTANIASDKGAADVAPEEMQLNPSNSTHELAVLLRTTGPRGRESHRSPGSARCRSKSLPRRLLGQLREYWNPTPDDVVVSRSAGYKYDGRLQAWVRGCLDTAPQSVSSSIVQRTTSKGNKYFELKRPPSPRTDGVFSRGDDYSTKPQADELDRLVLRDMTSNEMMDGWLADLGEKVDSCSNPVPHSLPRSPTASAAGARLSLLLPSTLPDESVVEARTLALTRASSTTGGRFSIWAPAALLRDSNSTVIRHTGAPSEFHEAGGDLRHLANDSRASLWDLEDTGMQNVDHSPTSRIGNDSQVVSGFPITWQTPSQSPKSSLPVPIDRDQSSVVSQSLTNHTFYTSASDDSDLDAPIDGRARERRSTEPTSGHAVVPRGSYRSDLSDEVAHRRSTNVTHTSASRDHRPSDQGLGLRRPKGSVPSLYSSKHPSATMRWIAPKSSPEARDFFMTEIEGDVARLSHATRSALLYAKASECVFCGPGVNVAGPSIDDETAARVQAPMPQTHPNMPALPLHLRCLARFDPPDISRQRST